MAEEEMNLDQLVQRFKDRKVSCTDLKRREEQRRNMAQQARKDGMIGLAQGDEAGADRIREARKKVCLLK